MVISKCDVRRIYGMKKISYILSRINLPHAISEDSLANSWIFDFSQIYIDYI